MSDLQAVVLGFVQGITEWLPISSTAHLQIVPSMLGWPNPPTHFKAVIQLGTLIAALVYFRRDILAILFRQFSSETDDEQACVDRRLLLPVLIGTIPVVVLGFAFRRIIETKLQNLYVEAGSLIVFAVLLGLAEARHGANREIGSVTLKDGLAVGIGQALALIPGASRSGTTITTALFLGLERSTAARFSFLLSLPAIFLAGMYELVKYRHEIIASHMIQPLVLATAVSFVVGLAGIHWLLKFLRTHPTYVFVAYRILLGLTIFGLLAAGRIK